MLDFDTRFREKKGKIKTTKSKENTYSMTINDNADYPLYANKSTQADVKLMPDTDSTDDVSSVLEEILPSFHMHNDVFYKTILDNSNENEEDDDANLPEYTSDVETMIEGNDSNDREIGDPINNPSLILLNNVDKLPRVNVNVSIKVVLTKKQPRIGELPEKESPLVEYGPGDKVTGYVLVKSNNKEPVRFESFHVSLEGVVKVPKIQADSTKKILSYPFLIMHDLNASYHEGHIPMTAYGEDRVLQADPTDNSLIGFKNRTIVPNLTHKKFFTFRLPYNLLDTTCPDNISEHLNLLPSYGLDEEISRLIEVNRNVDPALKYRRFENLPDSPILVNDLAPNGQSISYFIKVQIVGRTSIVKKVKAQIPKDVSSRYSIFNVKKCYLRVKAIREGLTNNLINAMSDGAIINSYRTCEQIAYFEEYVIKSLQRLKTRAQLITAGIKDKVKQDEYIASLESDETKKAKHLNKTTNLNQNIIRCNNHYYLNHDKVEISKDIFGRSGGSIYIKASMSSDSHINSIKSHLLHGKSENRPIMNRNYSLPLSHTTSNSTLALSSVRSSPNFNELADQDVQFIELDLQYRGKLGRFELPSSININSVIKAVNVSSVNCIPFNIDGEFLMDDQLHAHVLPSLRANFKTYGDEVDMLRDRKVLVGKELRNSIEAIKNLTIVETPVSKVEFSPEVVDLTKEWRYEEETKCYKASIRVPLELNSKLLRRSSVHLLPTFESCLVSQFYLVYFTLSIKKSKKYITFKFPIKVV